MRRGNTHAWRTVSQRGSGQLSSSLAGARRRLRLRLRARRSLWRGGTRPLPKGPSQASMLSAEGGSSAGTWEGRGGGAVPQAAVVRR